MNIILTAPRSKAKIGKTEISVCFSERELFRALEKADEERWEKAWEAKLRRRSLDIDRQIKKKGTSAYLTSLTGWEDLQKTLASKK